MDHFAGLDVSVKDTSVCIVDDTGRTQSGLNITRLESWSGILLRKQSRARRRAFMKMQRRYSLNFLAAGYR
jgi:hypothetical protein